MVGRGVMKDEKLSQERDGGALRKLERDVSTFLI